ncbi:MAG: cadherin-like beta sandwich domain-containing protein [Spirochaetes bacterium]|nr:cadherin-like beta sandwich domain-containing protein [Spirochaetota bacterium]MBN2770331.1 cadherin-like beta sandwich domain-containing protein [Spirochaetota bacterium]
MKHIVLMVILLLPISLVLTTCDGSDNENGDGGLVNGHNVNLESLELSSGNLSPSFVQSKKEYSAEVDNSVSAITITATSADDDATISINGNIASSGTASASISLSAGQNTITIKVTADDNTTSMTYTVVVTRLVSLSNNANLADLSLSSGTLSPSFSADITYYTTEVDNSTSSIAITPTVAGAGANVKVRGITVASGSASNTVPLAVGQNIVTTVVTSADNITNKTYIVVITRLESSSNNANLSDLSLSSGTISPSFSESRIYYTAEVNNSISSIAVTPTVAGIGASVTVNDVSVASGSASGSIGLAVGQTTITIVVTAGIRIKTYYVVVTRLDVPSDNANLSNLSLSSGVLSPSFAENTDAYTAQVNNNISSIKVTPTAAGVSASVTVNGVSVVSGMVSDWIALEVGQNTITIVVTAEDNITTKTCTVVVTRLSWEDSSNNADLSGLSISAGSLSPVFDVNTISYTAQVDNTVTLITVTPVVAGAGASVTVNGVLVASGTASGPISLAAGQNTITVAVTSEDSTVTKTYRVVVTRLYCVIYHVGTGNTSGTVPVDSTSYRNGDTITVSGNSGFLEGEIIWGTTKKVFIGWDTDASATAAQYKPGSTFTIGSDTVLYAIYTALRLPGPAGGLIFYDAGSVQSWGQYLEAAPVSTEWTDKVWGGFNTEVSGAGGTEIGTGTQNTTDIVTQFGTYEPYENKDDYAAKLCTYLNYGGYSDWFLPSKNELWYMCWNLKGLKYEDYLTVQNPDVPAGGVGGFSNNYYWSSSETYAVEVWGQDFDNGCQSVFPKDFLTRVRAVRAFAN